MDSNVITPNIIPGLTLPPVDKLPGGQITELPPEMMPNFKPGNNLILQTMLDNSLFQLAGKNSSDVSLLTTVLKTNLQINNQSYPVEVKLDIPLALNPEQAHQVAAKIVSANNNSLKLQFTAIDNQRPEVFVPANKPNANNQVQSSTIQNSIIKPENVTPPAVEFLPLKAAPLLENIMTALKIPQQVQQQVISQLPPAQLETVLKDFAARPQPELNEKLLAPLRESFQQLAAAPQKLSEILPQITRQLADLSGQSVSAQLGKNDGAFSVVDSPLGQLISPVPLKLEPQTPLLVQIKNVLLPPVPVNAEPLMEMLGKLFEKMPLPEIPQLKPSQIAAQLMQNEQALPLLKIIEPLKAQSPLAEQIFNKIPALNNKMLSNLQGFMKAASTHNVEAWLGKEIVAELKAQGTAGQEALSRASEFVSLNAKDTVGWRMVAMPFFDGSTMSQIKLAVRKKNEDEENQDNSGKAKSGMRFLVETDFSRLGQFQFDGFSIANERRFDLIIRTSRAQPEDFCAQIMNLFKTSLHEVEYVGNIKINLQENFIKVSEDANQLPDGVYI